MLNSLSKTSATYSIGTYTVLLLPNTDINAAIHKFELFIDIA